jgi:hypothetical protein
MYRGYQIQTQYAEAFEIIKIKDDTNLFFGERRTGAVALRNQLSAVAA